MTTSSAFKPAEHLMKLGRGEAAKDYLPVQWRLVWFREACPQGTIDTEEMEVDTEREMTVEQFVWNAERRRSEKVTVTARGYARFRAVVTDGQGGRATGTKSECRASFEDYIEKAETGAVGRALAALGYGTQFAPELTEGDRLVDSPVVGHDEEDATRANMIPSSNTRTRTPEERGAPPPPARAGNGIPTLGQIKSAARSKGLFSTMAEWEQLKATWIGEQVSDAMCGETYRKTMAAKLAQTVQPSNGQPFNH